MKNLKLTIIVLKVLFLYFTANLRSLRTHDMVKLFLKLWTEINRRTCRDGQSLNLKKTTKCEEYREHRTSYKN